MSTGRKPEHIPLSAAEHASLVRAEILEDSRRRDHYQAHDRLFPVSGCPWCAGIKPLPPPPSRPICGATSGKWVCNLEPGHDHAHSWSAPRDLDVMLSSPEVPAIDPRVREIFDETLAEHPPPAGPDPYLAWWLGWVRDIAGSRLLSDAQAGARIRELLYPRCIHEDDGTVEGCPGCFPPAGLIPATARLVPPGHRGWQPRPEPFGHDLDWVLRVIEIVDRHLDEAAPPEYKDNPLANRWRRIAAGPVSEAVEAADALNLATGGNPRKGVIGDEDDILLELADTAAAALFAIQSVTKGTHPTWQWFLAALAKALSRVPQPESIADYYQPPEDRDV
jgi:hypothetical protein